MVLVLLADGFEEIEALTPVDVLRRGGLQVLTCSIKENCEVSGAHGITIKADEIAENIDSNAIDLLILPGGMPGAKNLDESPFTNKFIDAVLGNGGRLAAICAAPMILGRRGLLIGKSATAYPGFEGELKGARIHVGTVITDGNITTAKGMGVALDFSLELLRLMQGREIAEKVATAIIKK